MLFITFLIAIGVAAAATVQNDYMVLNNQEVPPVLPFKRVNVTAHDGIILEAILVTGTCLRAACPGIVFISSWGLNKYEYVYPALEYYKRGYNVLSYTSRGFWGSSQRHDLPGGQIELAGADDIADVSTMIDYLLANSKTDVKKIGLSGISYGGGLSLLGAANDARVKAAIAMSCWVNLPQSFFGYGGTIRTAVSTDLDSLAKLTGTESEKLIYLFENYAKRENIPELLAIVKGSSPLPYLPSINAQKPAIFIANAYSDSIFTPNQFPPFFNNLADDVPKHIEFAPGDHAGPELAGLFPEITNVTSKAFRYGGGVWDRAFLWADAYVKDYDNTVKSGTPVLPTVILDRLGSNNTLDAYNSLDEMSTSKLRLHLVKRGKLMPYDPEIVRHGSELASLTTGKGVNVKGGIAIFSATFHAYLDDNSRAFVMRELDETYGAFFLTPLWDDNKTRRVRGTVSVDLNVQVSAPIGLLVAYALDCDRSGEVCHLISFAPYTYTEGGFGGDLGNTHSPVLTTYYYHVCVPYVCVPCDCTLPI